MNIRRLLITASAGMVLIFLMVVSLRGGGPRPASTGPGSSADNPLDVDAKHVVATYADNVVAGDQSYRNKYLRLTAEVASIEKREDSGFIVWLTTRALLPISDFESSFPSEQLQAANLRPGRMYP